MDTVCHTQSAAMVGVFHEELLHAVAEHFCKGWLPTMDRCSLGWVLFAAVGPNLCEGCSPRLVLLTCLCGDISWCLFRLQGDFTAVQVQWFGISQSWSFVTTDTLNYQRRTSKRAKIIVMLPFRDRSCSSMPAWFGDPSKLGHTGKTWTCRNDTGAVSSKPVAITRPAEFSKQYDSRQVKGLALLSGYFLWPLWLQSSQKTKGPSWTIKLRWRKEKNSTYKSSIRTFIVHHVPLPDYTCRQQNSPWLFGPCCESATEDSLQQKKTLELQVVRSLLPWHPPLAGQSWPKVPQDGHQRSLLLHL